MVPPAIFSDEDDDDINVKPKVRHQKGNSDHGSNQSESEGENGNLIGKDSKKSSKHSKKSTKNKESLDDDSEGEGDDLINNPMDEDDEEDEDEDEEMNEEERKFFVDDDEEEEEEDKHKKRKRKHKRKHRSEESDSEIDEDDLQLISENRNDGKKGRRFRRKGEEDNDSLALSSRNDSANKSTVDDIFFEEDNEGADLGLDEGIDEDEDDLDDFIVDDDEMEGDDEAARAARVKRKEESRKAADKAGASIGYSGDVWRRYHDLFDYMQDYGVYFDMLDNEEYLQDQMDPEYGNDDYDNEDRVPTQGRADDGYPSRGGRRDLKLADIYDPAELRENLLTEEDEVIRVADIPERFQLRGGFKELADGELDREARWIYTQLKELKRNSIDKNDEDTLNGWKTIGIQTVVETIFKILELLRIELFEVPMIYVHRRDYFNEILSLRDLWRIYDLDLVFGGIETKRSAVISRWKDVQQISEEAARDDNIFTALDRADGIETINEVFQHIKLRFPKEIQTIEDKSRITYKIAQRTTVYDIAIRCGIKNLTQKFGFDPMDFVQNCTLGTNSNITNANQTPEDAAKEFAKGPYKTPADALTAARLVLATEIASNPGFRRWVRLVYANDASISVTPTKKGFDEIEPASPFYHFKYLNEKPLYKFHDAQFLQILQAEKQGLVTLDLSVEESEKFIDDCKSKVVTRSSSLWDEQRSLVIEQAMKQIVFPAVVAYHKDKISQVARENLAYECQMALQSKINVAPYKPEKQQDDEDDDEEDEEKGAKILTITWGEGENNCPTYAVFTKENGQFGDAIVLPKLRAGLDYAGNNVELLTDFIVRYEPHVIAIAGMKPNTLTQLHKTIVRIVEDATTYGKLPKAIPITFIEDDAARLYMNSKLANKEFPVETYPPLVQYSISLARRMQDPIAELSRLVNADNDILNLYLHPLQDMLSENELKNSVTKAFVNVVNEMCVDINKAAFNSHLSGTVQFVCGLGPRKAQFLISKIQKLGELTSRANIVKKKIFGAKIFMNCAAFLRVLLHNVNNYYDEIWDILDDTRIHPEDYHLARQMAADALDLDDANVDDGENPSQHVAELMESEDVEKLHQLALDEFAAELKRQSKNKELKKITLNMILQELINPCKDNRIEFKGASADAIFTMLTNETDYTIKPGMIVNATITKIMDRFVRCSLNNGLQASIFEKNLPNDNQYSHGSLNDRYNEYQTLKCKVLSIDKTHLSLELSAVDIDLDQIRAETKVDEYFSRQRERDDIVSTKNALARKSKQRQVRRINHPYFQAVDYKGAQQILQGRSLGSMIIRPSTKGNNHFAITIKIDENVYIHIDVVEHDKESEFTLGKTLVVAGQKFSEIDEIIAQYVEPLFRKIYTIQTSSKFKRLNSAQLKRYLTEQSNSSGTLAYGFIHADNAPGRFIAMHKLPNSDPVSESLYATNKYLGFRKKQFPNIEAVIQDIKRRAR